MDRMAGLINVDALFAVASRSASANGSEVDISGLADDLLVTLDSGAGDDADATLDLKIQHRADSTDDWADIPAAALYNPATGEAALFTQVTNAAAALQSLALKRDRLKAEIRAVLTLGGATPVFICAVHVAGLDKYANW